MATARKKKTAKRPIPSTGHLGVPKLLRATEKQWANWSELAEEDKRSLSDWIRVELDKIYEARKG
jgi:hypothetical protein